MPLLVNRRGPLLGLDLCGEPDRRDIVAGALLPAPCEAARTGKVEIVAALARAGLGIAALTRPAAPQGLTAMAADRSS